MVQSQIPNDNAPLPLPADGPPPAPARQEDAVLNRVRSLASRGSYEEAIRLSHKHGAKKLDLINARGVCLLRLGKHDQAVALFRTLVLDPSGVWMRQDRPPHYKTNFATALLLAGHPSGCVQILDEMGEHASPAAAQLRAAIRRWTRTLSLWQRFDWWVGGIDPSQRPITLDFEPGEF